MKPDRSNAVVAFWGIAEATVFFIVPDVLLSWLALRDFKRALVGCLWALGGALVGACGLWFVALANPDPVRTRFASLPAINDGMIASVGQQLDESGLTALFVGPLIGTPYKIYTLEAANSGFSLALFLLVSIPARLMRFVLVTIVAGAASQVLRRRLSMRVVQAIHAVLWISFYVWYFSVMA